MEHELGASNCRERGRDMLNVGRQSPPFGSYEGQKPRNLAVLEMRGFLSKRPDMQERLQTGSQVKISGFSPQNHVRNGERSSDTVNPRRSNDIWICKHPCCYDCQA